jgi:photosystem II stability/assembly factor-like uncharacterized protein
MAMVANAETIFGVAQSAIYKGSGSTWTDLVNGNSTLGLDWRGIGVSADGMQVMAAANNGGLWRSVNGGTTWAKVTNATMDFRGWTGVALSADGQKILASSEDSGGLFRSTDFGA